MTGFNRCQILHFYIHLFRAVITS